jgi:hypothetical protein
MHIPRNVCSHFRIFVNVSRECMFSMWECDVPLWGMHASSPYGSVKWVIHYGNVHPPPHILGLGLGLVADKSV